MARLFGWLRPEERDRSRPERTDRRATSRNAPTAREVGQQWASRLDAVARFIDQHGAVPSRTSADPDERSLANWLRHQRRTELTPARQRALDARVPGWKVRRRNDDRFDAAVARVQQRTKTRTPLEKRDHGFLTRQRVKLREGTLTPDRRRRLDRARPGWDR